MYNEKIILKKAPPLECIFNEASFQIINSSNLDNEGVYEYSSLKSIEFEKEKTNWLITILSYIVELFAGGGGGNIYRDKKTLTINMVTKKIKLNLLDCEQKTIDQLISTIRLKSNIDPNA